MISLLSVDLKQLLQAKDYLLYKELKMELAVDLLADCKCPQIQYLLKADPNYKRYYLVQDLKHYEFKKTDILYK